MNLKTAMSKPKLNKDEVLALVTEESLFAVEDHYVQQRAEVPKRTAKLIGKIATKVVDNVYEYCAHDTAEEDYQLMIKTTASIVIARPQCRAFLDAIASQLQGTATQTSASELRVGSEDFVIRRMHYKPSTGKLHNIRLTRKHADGVSERIYISNIGSINMRVTDAQKKELWHGKLYLNYKEIKTGILQGPMYSGDVTRGIARLAGLANLAKANKVKVKMVNEEVLAEDTQVFTQTFAMPS